MIKVTMQWPNMKMSVIGHARYAETGKDIVCAAASMLTYALAGSLEEAHERGRTSYTMKEKEGMMILEADPNLSNAQEIKAYFRMACKGFRMLHELHPYHIEIREVN